MARSKKKCGVTVMPELPKKAKMRFEVGNLQGVGARERQEDSFTVMNTLAEEKIDRLGLMFCVCDGMGGMKDGKIASETAIRVLRDLFGNMDRDGNIPQQLEQAVAAASAEVERTLGGDGGSTVVIGIIFREQLYFASVGDSFMYLYRNGGLYRLNSEHNICHERYLENVRYRSTETYSCRADPEAPALTQFLGMQGGVTQVDLSVKPLVLHKGDMIVACSDGVGGYIDESEIIESLMWPDSKDRCERLEKHIMERRNPNQDNYTALIVKCL